VKFFPRERKHTSRRVRVAVIVCMSGAHAQVLTTEAVINDQVTDAAQFILLCKKGDATAATDFLRRVLAEIDGSSLDMAALSSSLGTDLIGVVNHHAPEASSPEGANAPPTRRVHTLTNSHPFATTTGSDVPVSIRSTPSTTNMPLYNDELDSMWCNLVVLIPGDMHVVGHVIGKGGTEVTKIEHDSGGASVKIEPAMMPAGQQATSPPNTPLERTVVISGQVVACVRAQRLLDKRVRMRLENDGIQREVLRMVVPNEFVRHLIGKSGANITFLESNSGIRIQVQSESTHQFGRIVTLQGAEQGRALAQYLISRQMAEGPYREWPASLAATAQQSSLPLPVSPSAGSAPQRSTSDSGGGVLWPPLHIPVASSVFSGSTSGRSISASSPGGAPLGAPRQIQRGAIQQQFSSANGNSVTGSTPAFFSLAGGPGQSTLSSSSWGSVESGAVHDNVVDEESSMQLSVPNSAVAFLIGRGGAAVSEIEQKSGAKINIAKPSANRDEDEANGRVVLIRGPHQAVVAAHKLVQMRLDGFVSPSPDGRGGRLALPTYLPKVSST
jgi:transcription antitermination factor NusA-like protein